jgi:hypothetical protein
MLFYNAKGADHVVEGYCKCHARSERGIVDVINIAHINAQVTTADGSAYNCGRVWRDESKTGDFGCCGLGCGIKANFKLEITSGSGNRSQRKN